MTEPETLITAYPDGPFIVRGPATFVTPDGTIVQTHRRTVALCRCGASAIKPWCDGTHKLTGFRDPADARGRDEAAQDEPGREQR